MIRLKLVAKRIALKSIRSYPPGLKDDPELSHILSAMKSAYLAQDLSGIGESLEMLLEIEPIFVKEGNGKTYNCVGGYRTLSVAEAVLAENKTVPVRVVSEISNEDLDRLIVSSLVLPSALHTMKEAPGILFSVAHAKAFAGYVSRALPFAATQKKIAGFFGVSERTVSTRKIRLEHDERRSVG